MTRDTRQLQVLAEQIRAVEEQWNRSGQDDELPPHVETVIGSLPRRRLHEWFGHEGETNRNWSPPLAILLDAARCARRSAGRGLIVWAGRAVWPYPVHLAHDELAHCVFVDPPDDESRLWAIDVSLRSEAVVAIVADGSKLGITATRRLQLAAEAGSSLALIARPGHERAMRSAAAFRWRVCTRVRESGRPAWSIEMMRGRDATGASAFTGTGATMEVQWRHGQGLVRVPAVVADRTADPARRSA